MRAAPERPAFYALGSGRAGDLIALLHPPYTAWHLGYFALGAAVAPTLYVNRLLWGLAAFALAVGVAAHALDELHDRPLRTGFSERTLIALAAVSLLGALAIGVAGAIVVSPLLVPLIVLGGLFLPAYNLEWIGGRVHGDLWFALGWGAFPAFTGYFVESLKIALPGVLIALGCAASERRAAAPKRAGAGAETAHTFGQRPARARRRQRRGADAQRAAGAARRSACGDVAGGGRDGLRARRCAALSAVRRASVRRSGSRLQQVCAGARMDRERAGRRDAVGREQREHVAAKAAAHDPRAGGAGLARAGDRHLDGRRRDLKVVAQAGV